MKKDKTFRLGELFCGPGGLAKGALSVHVPGFKIEHAWANDFDQDTCNTYIQNICPDRPESVICQDVRTLDIESLGPIEALAFGFPCNDFSLVGEKKGLNGTYGPLYSYGEKALRFYQPEWFMAENVGGLIADDGGKTLPFILSKFEDCGYRLYPHLYKFEEYGVPQTRHRIIIVGIHKDLDVEFKVPAPTTATRMKSCKEAIENPPIEKNVFNNEYTKHASHIVERLKYIKPGQNAFNADIPEELQLHVSGATLSQIYKRLDPDKPAYTVTGSGGGGTHIYHWSENRALTNRERARLQTFPDDYVFMGTKEKVRRQIGMAVPCDGAKIIVEAILKSFRKQKYRFVPCNIGK